MQQESVWSPRLPFAFFFTSHKGTAAWSTARNLAMVWDLLVPPASSNFFLFYFFLFFFCSAQEFRDSHDAALRAYPGTGGHPQAMIRALDREHTSAIGLGEGGILPGQGHGTRDLRLRKQADKSGCGQTGHTAAPRSRWVMVGSSQVWIERTLYSGSRVRERGSRP